LSRASRSNEHRVDQRIAQTGRDTCDIALQRTPHPRRRSLDSHVLQPYPVQHAPEHSLTLSKRDTMNPNDFNPETPPDVAAILGWFGRMQAMYPEPRPEDGDPAATDAWTKRGLMWARRVDPAGADAAMEALLECAVEEGIVEHDGVTSTGKIIYRSLIYRQNDGVTK
jgi:hypothetical protein